MTDIDPFDLPEPPDDRPTNTTPTMGRLTVNIAKPAPAPQRVAQVLSTMVPNLSASISPSSASTLGMLMTLNPKLAMYTLIPAPLVICGSWFFWKRVHPKHYRYWDSSSKQAGMLTGMLSGIRVVKAFAQEEREYERFNKISD